MRRGFSLLEVMVAVAILGLVLTVILAAQGNLSARTQRSATMGLAASAARCKMSELEEKLIKFGYPEMDEVDLSVPCCEGAEIEKLVCDTRVEKIELPKPSDNALGDGGTMLGEDKESSSNPVDMLNAAPNAPPSADGGLAAFGQSILQQMGGKAGLFQMVMGVVYPSFKSMFEASIRRITVLVHWKEGGVERSLNLVQYVTQPTRGGFSGAEFDAGAALPTSPSSSPLQTGASSSSPGSPSSGGQLP